MTGLPDDADITDQLVEIIQTTFDANGNVSEVGVWAAEGLVQEKGKVFSADIFVDTNGVKHTTSK
jgi:hypothetical protein